MSQQSPDGSGAPRRRRTLRKLLITLVVVAIIVVGAGLLLLPAIASSIAPAMATETASASVAGSINVEKVRVRWFAPIEVGPLQIADADGNDVADVTLGLGLSLWDVVSKRMWSANSIDIGVATIDGNVSLVRYEDGSTNLQRALAPPTTDPIDTPAPSDATPSETPPAPSTPKKSNGDRDIKGTLQIDALDIAVRDEALDRTASLGAVTGELAFDTRRDGTGDFAIDLTGRNDAGAQTTVKSALTLGTGGAIEANIDVQELATSLLAALGVQHAETIGTKASLVGGIESVDDGASLSLTLQAENANASLNGSLKDEVLTIEPGASAEIPAPLVAAFVPVSGDDSGPARLSSTPDMRLQIDRFELPVSQAAIESRDLTRLDIRRGALDLTLVMDGVEGELRSASADAFQPFAAEEVRLQLTSDDLAEGVHLTGNTSATVDGKSAGTVAIDITAMGLLDDNGRINALKDNASPVGGIVGNINIDRMSGMLVRQVLGETGEQLAPGAVPYVDLQLTAKTDGSEPSPGALPNTNIDVRLDTSDVNVNGAMRLANGILTTRDGPVTINVDSATALLGDTLEGVSGAGGLKVTLTDVRVPIEADDPLADLAMTAQVAITNLTREDELLAEPITVDRLTIDASIDPNDADPKVLVDGALKYGARPFQLGADVSLRGVNSVASLLDAIDPAVGPEAVRELDPEGSAGLRRIPRELLEAIMAGDDAPLDPTTARLLEGLAGDAFDLAVQLTPATGDTGARTDAIIALNGAATFANIKAEVQPNDVHISADGQIDLPRATANAFLIDPESGEPGDVTLATDAPIRWSTTRVKVPVTNQQRLNVPGAGAMTLTLETADRVLIDQAKEEGAPATLGVDQGFKITANVRAGGLLSSLPPESRPPLPIAITANGAMIDRNGEPLGAVNTNARYIYDADEPGRIEQARFVVQGLRPANIDGALGTGRQVSDLIGAHGRATIDVAPGEPVDGNDTWVIDAEVNTPRMTTERVTVNVLPDRIVINQPATLNWTPGPALLNSVLALDGEASAVRVVGETPINLNVERFSVGRGETPLRSDLFDIRTRLDAGRVTMQDRTGQAITLGNVSGSLTWLAEQALGFDLSVGSLASRGRQASQPAQLTGKISRLADESGALDTENAAVSLDGTLDAFPTPIIDAIGGQGGVLVAFLGPTMDANLVATNFSKNGGTLNANVTAPRANSVLNGQVRDGAFIANGPVELTLVEITPELTASLANSLPTVGTIQKTRADRPAVVRAAGLTIPLDGDLAKLNGDVVADLGVIRYTTANALGPILKATGMQTGGVAGKRIEPLHIKMREGVLSYDRHELPIGEFRLSTEGSVDLVNREIDVITRIPFLAITDEIAGGLNTNLAGVDLLGDNTSIPFRTRGSLSNPKVEPDIGLAIQEAGENLIETPGRIIEGILNGGRKKK